MANPLKILTVLTASQAAQFKEAVELSGAVTARDGVTVSGGNVSISAGNLSVVGTMSASSNIQVGGNVTVAGDITLRDANLRDARLSGNAYLANAYLTGAFLSGDAYLANAYLTGAYLTSSVTHTSSVGLAYVDTAYVSGASFHVDNVAFNTITSSIKTLITNEATARIAGDAAVAATASANLNTVSGALKTYIDAQDTADAAAWAAADAQVAATASANLTSLSQSVSSSHYTAKAALEQEDTTFLKLDGSRAMTGNLNASSVQVSASSLNVGGAAYVGGDLSVQGNLQVLGNIDAISRSDLYVADAVIMVASGAANAAAANGAGLEVDGADASFKYASSGDRWLANKDMEVSAAYYAGGQKLLEKANIGAAVGAKLSYSTYGYVGIANFTDGNGVLIEGEQEVGIAAPDLTVVATSSFARNATFQAQVAMDAALKLSGSTFAYIATPIVSGKYDVNDAIRALDVAVSGAANQAGSDLNTLKSNYDALRQVITGTLDGAGHADFTLAGAQFVAGQLDNIALDVMVKESGSYTNDLVALRMSVSGSAIKIEIDAPAAASADYRLIAVNEADGKL